MAEKFHLLPLISVGDIINQCNLAQCCLQCDLLPVKLLTRRLNSFTNMWDIVLTFRNFRASAFVAYFGDFWGPTKTARKKINPVIQRTNAHKCTDGYVRSTWTRPFRRRQLGSSSHHHPGCCRSRQRTSASPCAAPQQNPWKSCRENALHNQSRLSSSVDQLDRNEKEILLST